MSEVTAVATAYIDAVGSGPWHEVANSLHAHQAVAPPSA